MDFARTTAGQYNVSLGRLRAAEIPVPPLPEQRRIVAELENGKSEVFWGHTRSQAEARKKRAATQDAARTRGWKSFTFEIAELVEAPAPGTTSPTSAQRRCRSIRSMRPPTTRPDKVQETAAAAEADKDDEPATWSVQPRHAPDKYG